MISKETAEGLCQYIGGMPHLNILHNPILAKFEQEVYPQLLQQSNQNQNSMDTSPATPTKELTFGEKRVGISFNPSNNENVDKIKRKAADAIDQLYELQNTTSDAEAKRCYAQAMTQFEDAAMWAVKAITKPTY